MWLTPEFDFWSPFEHALLGGLKKHCTNNRKNDKYSHFLAFFSGDEKVCQTPENYMLAINDNVDFVLLFFPPL